MSESIVCVWLEIDSTDRKKVLRTSHFLVHLRIEILLMMLRQELVRSGYDTRRSVSGKGLIHTKCVFPDSTFVLAIFSLNWLDTLFVYHAMLCKQMLYLFTNPQCKQLRH